MCFGLIVPAEQVNIVPLFNMARYYAKMGKIGVWGQPGPNGRYKREIYLIPYCPKLKNAEKHAWLAEAIVRANGGTLQPDSFVVAIMDHGMTVAAEVSKSESLTVPGGTDVRMSPGVASVPRAQPPKGSMSPSPSAINRYSVENIEAMLADQKNRTNLYSPEQRGVVGGGGDAYSYGGGAPANSSSFSGDLSGGRPPSIPDGPYKKQWEEYYRKQNGMEGSSSRAAPPPARAAQPPVPEGPYKKQWEEYYRRQRENQERQQQQAQQPATVPHVPDGPYKKQWEEYYRKQGRQQEHSQVPPNIPDGPYKKEWEEYYRRQNGVEGSSSRPAREPARESYQSSRSMDYEERARDYGSGNRDWSRSRERERGNNGGSYERGDRKYRGRGGYGDDSYGSGAKGGHYERDRSPRKYGAGHQQHGGRQRGYR